MPDRPRLLGGRYELGDLLGRGGMAEVLRAHDQVLHRDVAIKLLATDDALDRERFDTEARLLAMLDHGNVVTVLDAGVDDGRPWLALELVEGQTLAARFAAARPSPGELAGLGAQVAAALAHAHERGVVHRDVKPSNVLLDTRGRARLTDFGIARLVEGGAALTMTGHTIGTAAFLAPEQVSGGPVTTATDVYALGLVLLEALTGRREYDGPPVEAALARLHRSPLVPVSLPTGWPALISSMTAMAPEDRPSADAVAERLRDLALRDGTALPDDDTGERTTAVPLGAARPAAPAAASTGGATAGTTAADEPRRRRRPAVLVAAAVAALALGVPALVVGSDTGADPASASDGTAATRDARPGGPSTPTPSRPARERRTAEAVVPVVEQSPAPRTPTRPAAVDPGPRAQGTGPKASGPKGKSKGKAKGKSKGKGKSKSKGKAKGKGKGKGKR